MVIIKRKIFKTICIDKFAADKECVVLLFLQTTNIHFQTSEYSVMFDVQGDNTFHKVLLILLFDEKLVFCPKNLRFAFDLTQIFSLFVRFKRWSQLKSHLCITWIL